MDHGPDVDYGSFYLLTAGFEECCCPVQCLPTYHNASRSKYIACRYYSQVAQTYSYNVALPWKRNETKCPHFTGQVVFFFFLLACTTYTWKSYVLGQSANQKTADRSCQGLLHHFG